MKPHTKSFSFPLCSRLRIKTFLLLRSYIQILTLCSNKIVTKKRAHKGSPQTIHIKRHLTVLQVPARIIYVEMYCCYVGQSDSSCRNCFTQLFILQACSAILGARGGRLSGVQLFRFSTFNSTEIKEFE